LLIKFKALFLIWRYANIEIAMKTKYSVSYLKREWQALRAEKVVKRHLAVISQYLLSIYL